MAMNPPIKDWHDRVVWVVGASSGIGLATAQALQACGARVVLSARSPAPLHQFASQHAACLALPLDVLDAAAVQRGLDQIVARYGQLDLVVHCAAHYHAMDVASFDLADLRRHMEVNYLGALNVLAAVLPALRQQGQGHISLVASVAGYRGLPQALAYGPTKAALQHLADGLYLDLHALGLGVSVVNPGFVDTPLTAANQFAMPALLSPQQAAQHMLRGWERGAFEIHFPKRFTWVLKLMQNLPHGCYFALVRWATQPRPQEAA